MKQNNTVFVSFPAVRFFLTLTVVTSAALVFLLVFSGLSPGTREHEIHFKDTAHELNVYRIYGQEPGPTLLIIGGIHNEPSGYLTADQYVDILLKKGNLIVVPRANFQTIIEDERCALGDMNRLFDLEDLRFENDHSMEIVTILKELISESDYLINLHDGWGFFRPEFIDDMHNPDRHGQSIITDIDVYEVPGTGKILPLQEIAEKICKVVNAEISNEKHIFRFNNHDTFSETTRHIEQRKSATFYALSHHHIPAFGIETSKDITDRALKVRYQTMIINAFMDEFGIVRDVENVSLPEPSLKFVAFSINGNQPQVCPDNGIITIRAGDKIIVEHIVANYERGLSADIVNYGSANDIGKPVVVYDNTSILIKKDGLPCGRLNVEISDDAPVYPVARIGIQPEPRVESFIVEVNGFPQHIKADGTLTVMKGDVICLIDTSPALEVFPDLKLNFFGYWSKNVTWNNGDDQNVEINTATDLDPGFSMRKGTEYEVRLERENEPKNDIVAQMRIRLVEPGLKHLILLFDNGNMGYLQRGRTYSCKSEKSFEIIHVETNIPNNDGVSVNVIGFVGGPNGNDVNMPIDLYSELLQEYSLDKWGRLFKIEVTYRGNLIGEAYLHLNVKPKNN